MKYLRSSILFFAGLILLLNLSGCNEDGIPGFDSDKAKFVIPIGRSYNYSDALISRVVDGDTLVLESGERVRLIGIDTPELHESNKLYKDAQRTKQDVSTIQKMGLKAYEFTKNLAEGKRCSLEFDVDKYDKYKRLLAYVYLKDGTFLNAQIVKEGYASLMTYPPNVKYADLFLKLYQEARENKRGLWK
ncbi:MAG: thermonuclease family protein [Candidatus Omnitrophica bacterium]|nr:thermonuclease family protein [Candidatus Omnitrophota bacterium]